MHAASEVRGKCANHLVTEAPYRVSLNYLIYVHCLILSCIIIIELHQFHVYMYVCIKFISTRKSHHYINNALPESRAYIQLYKSM
jgi:predicted membrane chloride channel (bestrophin family)